MMKRQIVCSHKCSQVCTLVHKQLCTLVHFRYQSLEEMYIPKRISFQEKTLHSYKSKTAGKIYFYLYRIINARLYVAMQTELTRG